MSPDMYLLGDTDLPETLVRSRTVIRARYESPQWMNPYYKHLVALAVIRSSSKVQVVSLITENLTTVFGYNLRQGYNLRHAVSCTRISIDCLAT
jgi:hypothetical protein